MRNVRAKTLAAVLLVVPQFAFANDYQALLADVYPLDQPGAAVVVARDHIVLFEGASGMSNLELDIPLTSNGVFRIASLTKQFTAAAVMLLVQEGDINLDDVVTVHLPDYPMHGHEITIEHLLTHTSGIPNITSIPEFFSGGMYRLDGTTDETLGLFRDKPLDFVPGERFAYSNSGYILLGAIVEKVTGGPFHEFVGERVFIPLGMENTGHDGPRIIKNRVNGYDNMHEGLWNTDFISMTRPHAAGYLVSTVGDLAKWSSSLFQGKVVDRDSLRRMTTSHVLSDGEGTDYGYGFAVKDLFGHPMIYHTGGINGFSSMTVWLPEQRVFVAVLTNVAGHEIGPAHLAYRMALQAIGMSNPFDTGYEADDRELPRFVGRYRINDDEVLRVTEDDGSLYSQRADAEPVLLTPYAEDAFFYPASFSRVVFERGANDEIVGAAIHDGPSEESTYAKRD